MVNKTTEMQMNLCSFFVLLLSCCTNFSCGNKMCTENWRENVERIMSIVMQLKLVLICMRGTRTIKYEFTFTQKDIKNSANFRIKSFFFFFILLS